VLPQSPYLFLDAPTKKPTQKAENVLNLSGDRKDTMGLPFSNSGT
jgi:hypothetical protein